jgi:hypothetical protein
MTVNSIYYNFIINSHQHTRLLSWFCTQPTSVSSFVNLEYLQHHFISCSLVARLQILPSISYRTRSIEKENINRNNTIAFLIVNNFIGGDRCPIIPTITNPIYNYYKKLVACLNFITSSWHRNAMKIQTYC